MNDAVTGLMDDEIFSWRMVAGAVLPALLGEAVNKRRLKIVRRIILRISLA